MTRCSPGLQSQLEEKFLAAGDFVTIGGPVALQHHMAAFVNCILALPKNRDGIHGPLNSPSATGLLVGRRQKNDVSG